MLAVRAGICPESVRGDGQGGKTLEMLVREYGGKKCDLLARAGVSERMFQYYMKGKIPTKQALIALLIAMGLPLPQIEETLAEYGYCFSPSLPEDAVILWFLQKDPKKGDPLLLCSINETLEELGLPLLMTKYIRR